MMSTARSNCVCLPLSFVFVGRKTREPAAFAEWKSKSVEEPALGVESKALKSPETPKISPWPNLALEVASHVLGSAEGRYGRSLTRTPMRFLWSPIPFSRLSRQSLQGRRAAAGRECLSQTAA
jgi:hypothetical protein